MRHSPKPLWVLAAAIISTIFIHATPASADRAPSKEVLESAEPSLQGKAVDAARARVALALEAEGLDAGQIEERLGQLTAEDIGHLSEHVDTIQAAGNAPRYIWILLAIFLGLLILGALV